MIYVFLGRGDRVGTCELTVGSGEVLGHLGFPVEVSEWPGQRSLSICYRIRGQWGKSQGD